MGLVLCEPIYLWSNKFYSLYLNCLGCIFSLICLNFFAKQNPLPYLARYPEADVLTSSDQVIPTVVDDSLDIWQQGDDCAST